MNQDQLLKQNEKLIYKQSWHYARKYNMDFEDIKSEAFEIFCKALDRFEEDRASFTTHLYYRLRGLNDYCKKQNIIEGRYLDHPLSEKIAETKQQVEIEDKILEKTLFYEAVDLLSSGAKKVMEVILNGESYNPDLKRIKNIGKYRVAPVLRKKLGWTMQKTFEVWEELQTWWAENCNEIRN